MTNGGKMADIYNILIAMGRKRTRYTTGRNQIEEMMRAEHRRAEKAMKEIRENDGAFSKETNAWLLEMGLLGEADAKMMYFGQAIRGLIPMCDWLLMEKWANDIVAVDEGMGYFMLGSLYSPATPGFCDMEKSRAYYQQGADAGHEECRNILKDIEEDIEFLRKPDTNAEQDCVGDNPHMILHFALQKMEEYQAARKELKLWLKDEPENPDALLQMAGYYANGLGVTKSYKQALQYYQLAADVGSAEGLFYVGLMHQEGNGCKQDYGIARECYMKAASMNYARAFFHLGICSELGLGVNPDPRKAEQYYKKGIALKDPECFLAMASAYLFGNARKQDFNKARKYLEAARENTAENNEYVLEKIEMTNRMLAFIEGGYRLD